MVEIRIVVLVFVCALMMYGFFRSLYEFKWGDKEAAEIFRIKSEYLMLRKQYLDQCEELEEKKAVCEKERLRIVGFAVGLAKCLEIKSGDRIAITQNGYLICEPYETFFGHTVLMIKKGAELKVLKEASVIRHGVTNYRCVYIDKTPDVVTEDNYTARGRARFLANKKKVFITEEELVRLKTLSFLFLRQYSQEAEKLRRLLDVKERAE
jgi:hypothetical protein